MSDMPGRIEWLYRSAERKLFDRSLREARRSRVMDAIASPAQKHAVGVRDAAVQLTSRAWGGWLIAASVAGLSVLVVSAIGPTHEAGVASSKASQQDRVVVATAEGTRAAGASNNARQEQHSDRVASAIAPAAAVPAPDHPARVPAGKIALGSPPAAFPSGGAAEQEKLAERSGDKAEVREVAGRAAVGQSRSAAASVDNASAGQPPGAFAATPASPGTNVGRIGSDARDADGASKMDVRLHEAARSGNLGRVAELIAEGQHVDSADQFGDTALAVSLKAGQYEVARYLREKGASLDAKNKGGVSPRDILTKVDKGGR
ncbi:ankyrin repeat domain-containing protein [Ottowia sp.]|uniref:ankyrin repeat domain-containing protein n=1 Tax=Ottowia sp. TaxID=1898956 RepID=UPI0025F2256F|nr:ankyrin repeat domain-containing protein [Ottowia sp.]MBK6616578.1 ankyrin repeat domain-containing protein [Ottowia sp.]